jgi:hypothetical protein
VCWLTSYHVADASCSDGAIVHSEANSHREEHVRSARIVIRSAFQMTRSQTPVTKQRKNASTSNQDTGADVKEQICKSDCRTASALYLSLKVFSYRGLLVP